MLVIEHLLNRWGCKHKHVSAHLYSFPSLVLSQGRECQALGPRGASHARTLPLWPPQEWELFFKLFPHLFSSCTLVAQFFLFINWNIIRRIQDYVEYTLYKYRNKPAAQAAGADPSRWSSTSRQNLPIQQNCRNCWTNSAILMPFRI